MNGYGGGAFDLDDFFGTTQTGSPSLNGQQQQQQSYQVAAPCFENYDPTAGAAMTAYNTTVTHTSYRPATTAATNNNINTLEDPYDPIPINPQISQAHTGISYAQQQQQQSHRQHHGHHGRVTHAPQQQQYQHQSTPHPSFTADKLMSSHEPFPVVSSTANHHQHHVQLALIHSSSYNSSNPQAEAARKESTDLWLDTIHVKVSGIAVDPLSGSDLLGRVRNKTDNVVTRYLPCVEFLISSQQELRQGIEVASQKRMIRHAYRDSLSPKQFFQRYLEPLPQKFYSRNKTLMETSVLRDGYREIQKLVADAKRVQFQGCEVMKNQFLGGMKDGESWGLRKWLSKHGGALQICTDLECILGSCQQLDRSADTTVKLAGRMRPLAKQALDRLKNDVPTSYQEVSSAHPYLPFYHRLESALKGMANFDPDDDDVVCIIDDDEIEEHKKKAAAATVAKRAAASPANKQPVTKRPRMEPQKANDDDDDSVIEIIDPPPTATAAAAPAVAAAPSPQPAAEKHFLQQDDWICQRCTMVNPPDTTRCCMCDSFNSTAAPLDTSNDSIDANELFSKAFANMESFEDVVGGLWDAPAPAPAQQPQGTSTVQASSIIVDPQEIVNRLDEMARLFESNQHETIRPTNVFALQTASFWDNAMQYATALRLFITLLCSQECCPALMTRHEADSYGYSSFVKHPLCFQDVYLALRPAEHYGSGALSSRSLSSWNMWRGMDLLQAIDLVILNRLAYIGKERTKERSETNKLRRILWDGINNAVSIHCGEDAELRRRMTPTRRGESSGFVVRK